MHTQNYKERIQLYLKSNPALSAEQLGTLISIDSIYKNIPVDLTTFRRLYSHLDPKQINSTDHGGIQFINIANSNEADNIIKDKLNAYINMKYYYLGHSKSYQENMVKFREHSIIVSNVLSDILKISRLSNELNSVFTEHPDVTNCTDFYDLLQLYKHSKDIRIKFEVLRKVGLIVLISRISRTFIVHDLDTASQNIQKVFFDGLGLEKQMNCFYYLWIDENEEIRFVSSKEDAIIKYQKAVNKRHERAMKIYPLQIFEYTPYKTQFNSNNIIHLEFRNKLKKQGKLYYTSFVEKMLRKNLEFPNEVHDVLGIKIVVFKEEQISPLVRNLQSFLGGTSTRKKEKNTLSKFGKKKLGKYSSDEYFVWKAIYDIALPHPSVEQIKKMMQITTKNEMAQRELKHRLLHFKEHPLDFVVEVQLQDINSYLLSIAKGTATDHALLKQKQILSNSFYKLFPKEIYEKELALLRNKILSNSSSIPLPDLHTRSVFL